MTAIGVNSCWGRAMSAGFRTARLTPPRACGCLLAGIRSIFATDDKVTVSDHFGLVEAGGRSAKWDFFPHCLRRPESPKMRATGSVGTVVHRKPVRLSATSLLADTWRSISWYQRYPRMKLLHAIQHLQATRSNGEAGAIERKGSTRKVLHTPDRRSGLA